MKQESRTNINRVKKDISSPDSFTPPEELKRQLITTMQSIYDEEDIEAVERAYKVAYKAHEKQKRKSGEPYIIHPICVAIILAELELDKETIMAGLLCFSGRINCMVRILCKRSASLIRITRISFAIARNIFLKFSA